MGRLRDNGMTEQVYAHYNDMKKGTTLKALSSALDNDKDDKKMS